MPLYEDKLISPFAVRFTQEHIRPVFQCGTDLEQTIREIKSKPGSAGYDIILDTPFEPIEIIRWHKRDHSGEEPEGLHWRTFDNRRLYCLQRVAAALWPQRVGVVVQALYSATEGAHRKDSSQTAGRAVSIGHSLKLITDTWAWRDAVARTAGPRPDEVETAQAIVRRDDERESVDDLVDAPAPPSMLDLFFQAEAAAMTGVPGIAASKLTDVDACGSPSTSKFIASETLSTTDPSSPRSTYSSYSIDNTTSPLSDGLCGTWQGCKGESYEVWASSEGWTCSSSKSKGRVQQVNIWYEAERDLLWFGDDWSLCAEASEVRQQGGRVRWYSSSKNSRGAWQQKMAWDWLGAHGSGASVAEVQQRRPRKGVDEPQPQTQKQPQHHQRTQPKHQKQKTQERPPVQQDQAYQNQAQQKQRGTHKQHRERKTPANAA